MNVKKDKTKLVDIKKGTDIKTDLPGGFHTTKIIEDRLLGIKDKSITVFKLKTGE